MNDGCSDHPHDTSRRQLPRIHSLFVRAGFWFGCCLANWTFKAARTIVVLALGSSQRGPPRRLSSPTCNCMAELIEQLPQVTLPPHLTGKSLMFAFAPCSNLCIYMFGAVACLRRSRNFAEVEPNLRYSGVSSGALVASVCALGTDVVGLFERCVSLLDALNSRRCGWIGAYSRSIRAIVQRAAEGVDVGKATANSKLSVGTTAFDPLPYRHEISSFASQLELEEVVLASCYIPVVWEDPIWLRHIGPCLDGGASGFHVQGDFVFSPYHSNLPDVGPAVEYPRQLVFEPVDARDMLRLFEDGYRDCARWITEGCQSRREERQERLFSSSKNMGFWSLCEEALAVLRSLR